MLIHDGWVCLIRRQREAGLQHSLPSGVVEDENGEDPADALRRERVLPRHVRVLPVGHREGPPAGERGWAAGTGCPVAAPAEAGRGRQQQEHVGMAGRQGPGPAAAGLP
ncbi:hypothetical protein GCM10009665_42450 [Kitasatospora nipponensis]|uniref:NUDIX domain-containing protein n=1 Tax=Kitasatospora nipponensis TaxID=258049 RepID=A0ABP4H1Y2_9ACTN